MPRFIRARRIRANNTETNQLRDQFIRQLTREAETTLKQMTQQFNQDLEKQSTDFFSGLNGGDSPGSSSGAGITGLFSSASRYLFSRPKISETTRDSTRSREESERFRLSQSQLMAEANAAIARGEKNT